MKHLILSTLLTMPAGAVAREGKPGKPEAAGRAEAAIPGEGKAAKKGEVLAEEAKARAEEKKGEHPAEHGGAPAAMPPGMLKASEQGQAQGGEAVEAARAIVQARGDVMRARAEARRGKKEQLMARLRAHAGHEMPMAAMREELRRHARRMARLARVRELAETAKDADSTARADKLIAREAERHERWMAKMGTPAAPGAPAAPAAPAQGGTP
jgi:hypothetical protein